MNLFFKKTKKARRSNGGFTLVETLVAISILSLAISGTFTAVQNGLKSSTFARDQITGFYLAQEAMEYIKNIRDENTLYSINAISTGGVGKNWLAGMSDAPGDPCYFGKTCTIDSFLKIMATCSGGFDSCDNLRQDSVTGLFGYTGSWPVTNFKREIQFQSISANEVMVTIHISWVSGSFSKSFQVSQIIFNRQ